MCLENRLCDVCEKHVRIRDDIMMYRERERSREEQEEYNLGTTPDGDFHKETFEQTESDHCLTYS